MTHRKIHDIADRNLKIFEKMLSEGKKLSNRNVFYYARELFINGRYDEAMVYYNKFLDTKDGLLSNYIDSSIDLARCHYVKGDQDSALKALLRSFEHEIPRAEICCQLGYHYKGLKEYKKAIFWFELASRLKKPEKTWGSVDEDCWGYVPFMELCSCYYRVDCIDEAVHYNEAALKCKPDDHLALYNKDFLKSELKNNEVSLFDIS